MKKLLTFAFILSAILVLGQEYKLFHENSNLLYASVPAEDATYGIAFDSVVMSGLDSVYYNYTFVSQELMESDTCYFWGSDYFCFPQDVPSWIGSQIYYDNISKYTFLTNQDDTLLMDFNIPVGDSSRFYLDSEQQFYMVYEGTDMHAVLGLYDSVRSYRISHYNLSGNAIFSNLHGKSVSIGKGFGLIDFFRIDSFPAVLEPLTLVGSMNQSAGITALTNEMIYDHQPGDIIQYRDYKFHDGGPPWLNYENFVTHTFLERTNLPDSINYKVARLVYKADSNLVEYDTISLKYKRNMAIAEIPFDKLSQEYIITHCDFYKTDYCDLNLWTYKEIPEYLMYCADDNCWGSFDLPGPPPSEQTIYVAGLGLYFDVIAGNGPPPDWYVYSYKLVYFKKDGVECGEEVTVNLADLSQAEFEISVYPNPTRDKFEVRSAEFEVDLVEVYDLSGKKHLEKHFPGGEKNVEIELNGITTGMYICRIIAGGSSVVKKLVVY